MSLLLAVQVFEDTATVTLALTPSSTDIEAYVDSNTEAFALTASSTDAAQFVDADIELFKFTPSGIDTAQFVDSGTEYLKLSPYLTEEYPVARLKFTLSSTETVDYDEIGTQDIDILGNVSTTGLVIQSNTVYRGQSFTPSSTGLLLGVAVKIIKSSNPTGDLIVEIRADNAGQPDNAVLASGSFPCSLFPGQPTPDIPTYISFLDVLQLTGGNKYWIVCRKSTNDVSSDLITWRRSGDILLSENRIVAGNPNVWDTTSPEDLHFAVRFDNPATQPRVTIIPSGIDTAQLVDANIELFALTPSATEGRTSSDANTETLALTASGTDQANFVDANTESLHLSPSASDILATSDAASEIFALIPSATENFQGSDASLEYLMFTPSADEQISGGAVDAGTELLALVPSASDIADFTDINTEALLLAPSSVETYERQDTDTEYLVFSMNSADVAEYADQNTGLVILTPSGIDEKTSIGVFTDANTVYLRLTPSAYELYKIYELIAWIGELRWSGFAFRKWWGKTDSLKYSGSMFRRWWGRID